MVTLVKAEAVLLSRKGSKVVEFTTAVEEVAEEVIEEAVEEVAEEIPEVLDASETKETKEE